MMEQWQVPNGNDSDWGGALEVALADIPTKKNKKKQKINWIKSIKKMMYLLGVQGVRK